MMRAPRVSVVMAAYNHERFVAQAIESVLRQKDVTFELLIEDDGSRDGTARVIQGCRDSRIHFVAKARNEGACATMNNLISRASGEFVAVINSDDVWHREDKLAYQVDMLSSQTALGATFGRAQIIDDAGVVLDPSTHYEGTIFIQENRSRAQWLRRLMLQGNCLCHPTAMVRRACYAEIGLLDNRLRQLPDLDLWLRLLKKYEIHVSERELVQFRILPGENASARTQTNITRARNELTLVYEHVLDGVEAATLTEAFGDVLEGPPGTPEEFEIAKALIYLSAGNTHLPLRMIGIARLHKLLGAPHTRELLKTSCGIDDAWFHDQMGQFSPYDRAAAPAPAAAQPSSGSLSSVKSLLGMLARPRSRG